MQHSSDNHSAECYREECHASTSRSLWWWGTFSKWEDQYLQLPEWGMFYNKGLFKSCPGVAVDSCTSLWIILNLILFFYSPPVQFESETLLLLVVHKYRKAFVTWNMWVTSYLCYILVKVYVQIVLCVVFYFTLRPIIQTVIFQILKEIALVAFILITKMYHCPIEDCEPWSVVSTFVEISCFFVHKPVNETYLGPKVSLPWSEKYEGFFVCLFGFFLFCFVLFCFVFCFFTLDELLNWPYLKNTMPHLKKMH